MVETDGGRPEVGVEPWVRDSVFVLGGINAPLGNGEYVYYGVASERTVQRWTSRARRDALWIQQAIRLSIIEEAEPRPVESLFEGGLSPPDAVMKRRWRSPADVETLWRAYEMLLVACGKLARHASSLLAGARRRWPTEQAPFGI